MTGRYAPHAAATVALLSALAGFAAEKPKPATPKCCATKTRCCKTATFCCDQPTKAECCKKKVACCNMVGCCGPKAPAKKPRA